MTPPASVDVSAAPAAPLPATSVAPSCGSRPSPRRGHRDTRDGTPTSGGSSRTSGASRVAPDRDLLEYHL